MLSELHARVRTALLDAGIDPMTNSTGARAVIDECLAIADSREDRRPGGIPIGGNVYRQAIAAVKNAGADPFALVPKEAA